MFILTIYLLYAFDHLKLLGVFILLNQKSSLYSPDKSPLSVYDLNIFICCELFFPCNSIF